MKAIFAITLLFSLTSCTTRTNVNLEHPYKDLLLGSSTSDVTLYLYKQEGHGLYSINTHELVTFTLLEGSQRENRYPPDYTIPPGCNIVISKILLTSSMSTGPATELRGTLHYENEELPITVIHEFVGIDLLQWQKEHGIMSRPTTKDYLSRAKRKTLPWKQSADVPETSSQ